METKAKVRALGRRHRRVRKRIVGTPERPRLAVHRSNRHIYAQIIDDFAGQTLAAASSLAVSGNGDPKKVAHSVGVELASKAKSAGITSVAFDRGGFMYHGRIQALAEGAREGGLDF
jgi:large subunit ribosomal protein L18